jgi:hypothetical protein
MPDPDYKALCAELVESLENARRVIQGADGTLHINTAEFVLRRANAALAQPKPAPTDEDLEDLAEVMNVSGNPVPAMRRALELWGNSQGILDSSPQPEPAPPTDEDLLGVAASKIDPYEGFGIAIGEYEQETECAIEVYGSELIAFARAVLARWGTPAINTRGTQYDD